MANKRVTFRDIEAGRDRCINDVPDEAIDPNNVMKVQCASCPWRKDGKGLRLSKEEMLSLVQQVLSQANQRCHAPSLNGAAETKICRGARDLQIETFYAHGVLDDRTDEAWARALEKK